MEQIRLSNKKEQVPIYAAIQVNLRTTMSSEINLRYTVGVPLCEAQEQAKLINGNKIRKMVACKDRRKIGWTWELSRTMQIFTSCFGWQLHSCKQLLRHV